MTEGEVVVPVVVGKSDQAPKGQPTETESAAPTSAPIRGQVESGSGRTSGGGSSASGMVASGSSGATSVMQGHVTDPSSGMTPTGAQVSSGSNQDPTEMRGLIGDDTWYPSAEDVMESTTSRSRPLRALERMRRVTRDGHGHRYSRGGAGAGGVGTMDVFAVLAQVNDQLGNAPDLESFLKVVVGVIKDLTQFHRVLVYQFDEQWNGQVVAELVDWSQTHDIFKGLHFPAADIPVQVSPGFSTFGRN